MLTLIKSMYVSDIVLINKIIYKKAGNVFHVLDAYDYYKPHGKYFMHSTKIVEEVAELPPGKRTYLEFIPY